MKTSRGIFAILFVATFASLVFFRAFKHGDITVGDFSPSPPKAELAQDADEARKEALMQGPNFTEYNFLYSVCDYPNDDFAQTDCLKKLLAQKEKERIRLYDQLTSELHTTVKQHDWTFPGPNPTYEDFIDGLPKLNKAWASYRDILCEVETGIAPYAVSYDPFIAACKLQQADRYISLLKDFEAIMIDKSDRSPCSEKAEVAFDADLYSIAKSGAADKADGTLKSLYDRANEKEQAAIGNCSKQYGETKSTDDTIASLQALQTADNDRDCVDALLAQNKYLESEKLSEKYTFEKYPASFFLTTKPADINTRSSTSARMFRTMIRQDLNKGVDFAGHYTIVSAALHTPQGYWIVDRSNGRAYEFLYAPYALDFRKESNLLIMDSKDIISKNIGEMNKAFGSVCSNIGLRDTTPTEITNLKPFYFLWENNELKLLGPFDIKPSINDFWEYSH